MEPEDDKLDRTQTEEEELVRTTIYLPRWLRKAIKREAANTERAMHEILTEQLSSRYADRRPDRQIESAAA